MSQSDESIKQLAALIQRFHAADEQPSSISTQPAPQAMAALCCALYMRPPVLMALAELCAVLGIEDEAGLQKLVSEGNLSKGAIGELWEFEFPIPDVRRMEAQQRAALDARRTAITKPLFEIAGVALSAFEEHIKEAMQLQSQPPSDSAQPAA